MYHHLDPWELVLERQKQINMNQRRPLRNRFSSNGNENIKYLGVTSFDFFSFGFGVSVFSSFISAHRKYKFISTPMITEHF